MVAQLTYLYTELPNQLDYPRLALDVVSISTGCCLILAEAGLFFLRGWALAFRGCFGGGSGALVVDATLENQLQLVLAAAIEADMLEVRIYIVDN